ELMLIARYFMFDNVYGHHTARIAEGMFQNAVANAIDAGDVDAHDAARMVDDQIMERLRSSKSASGVAKRIDARDLFKRAYYKPLDEDVRVSEIEGTLGRAGLDKRDYVVSFKGFGADRGNVVILSKDGARIGTLNDSSPLMKTIDGLVKNKKRLLVACDKRNVAKARAAVVRLVE
ncbi:MAG: hypothetical protein ACREBW_07825, partial [Candidatus Micrarchaeaceae archaeon]